jgi:Predicted membrane protein
MGFRESFSKEISIRSIVAIAILAALAELLSFFTISGPPPLKFDFTLVPIVFAVLFLGPISGFLVALIKSLLHLTHSGSKGIGTLMDFVIAVALILGIWLVLLVVKKRTLIWCVVAIIAGSVLAGIVSVPMNVFVVYPLYGASANLLTLAKINLPFTIVRCLICGILGDLILSRLKPILDRI